MTTFGKTVLTAVVAIIIIVGISFVLMSSGGTPSGTATTTPVVVQPKTTLYSNPDLGFSFRYPETFSVAVQNYADTAGHKTLLNLTNADKTQTIRVSVLNDPKTGKPLSPDIANYEKALISDVIFDGSGANPKSFDEFQSRKLGDARFAYIKTGLFEGVLGVSYYAVTPGGIVSFTLTEQGVDWTNPAYDVEKDSGHLALQAMLATFKVGAYSAASTPVSYAPYQDASGTYSVNAPAGWKINAKFGYDAIGPDKKIPGVSFAIPAAFTSATNLSSDSYISIEKNPYATSCVAAEFTSTATTNPEATNATIGGLVWNVGESSDVGAGNLYNERIYATKHGSDCYGIRLFLHSGQVDNYDAGARQQFDKAVLTKIEDDVATSFKFLK